MAHNIDGHDDGLRDNAGGQPRHPAGDAGRRRLGDAHLVGPVRHKTFGPLQRAHVHHARREAAHNSGRETLERKTVRSEFKGVLTSSLPTHLQRLFSLPVTVADGGKHIHTTSVVKALNCGRGVFICIPCRKTAHNSGRKSLEIDGRSGLKEGNFLLIMAHLSSIIFGSWLGELQLSKFL
jgi:hypothetical protein